MDILLTSSWQFALVVAALVAEAALTWKRPEWGAAAVVFLLPSYLVRIRDPLPAPTNVLELLVLVFVISVSVRHLMRRDALTRPAGGRGLWIPIALIVGGATASAAYGIGLTGYSDEAMRVILGSLKGFVLIPVLFTVLLSSLSHYRDQTPIVVGAYAVSAVAAAAISVIGGLASTAFVAPDAFVTFDARLRGFYLSPNHLAMYILPAILLPAGMSKPETQRPKRMASHFYSRSPARLVLLLVLLVALLWTKSLGAIIGLLAGLAVYALFRFDKTRLLPSFFCFLIVVGILLPLLAVHLSDVLVEPGERSPLASRIMIWRAATDILRDNWLFGIGPGAFQYHYLTLQEKYPPYLEWAVPQPHNFFLALWLQTGLLGLVGLLALLFTAIRRVALYPPTAALVAILVYGFVDTPFWKNDLAVLVFLLCGVATVFEGPEVSRQHQTRPNHA